MPNWRYDVVCVSAAVVDEMDERFAVDLGEVHKPRQGPTGVKQVLPRQTLDPWHRPQELADAVRARHSQHYGDQTGSSCDRCGRWKWFPVSENDVPIVGSALVSSSDVIASPEVFGDGLKSFRHVLLRRHLGEALAGASPRNWDIVEVTITQVAGS